MNKATRSQDRCFACRQLLTATKWIIRTGNTSNIKLCTECADILAARDNPALMTKA